MFHETFIVGGLPRTEPQLDFPVREGAGETDKRLNDQEKDRGKVEPAPEGAAHPFPSSGVADRDERHGNYQSGDIKKVQD